METNKKLRVWTEFSSPEEDFKYLDHAVKEATAKALKHNTEALVTLDTENEVGDIISSVKVAIIRGNKFNSSGGVA